MHYIALFNPFADNGKGKENAQTLTALYPNDEFDFIDVTTLKNHDEFIKSTSASSNIVLCGGDGTLNRFVNAVDCDNFERKLFYFACGSGNDFARDVDNANGNKLIPLNDYVKNLPIATVKGNDYKFINGVGYGIDGYCCEEGDRQREKNPQKKINYTTIAIKGLLFHYKPTDAIITVDGKDHFFKKVWIAPTMHGRYYGGGMLPAPAQTRENEAGTCSVTVFHDSSKLRTLCIFPSIFKGEHVKSTKFVTVLSGSEISVKFGAPRPLQVDGETIKNVSEYAVKSAKTIKG